MEEREQADFQVLLERVAKNDQAAFSALYDLFAAELIKHILSKIGDKEVAEDILHDLFLSLWKNRARINQIQSLPAYLYSSCRYLILNYFRQQIQKGIKTDIENLDLLDNTIPIEERMHYRYVIDIVDNEIENLPEKCRQIFKLSRKDYLSNKEIAQQLNIAESTVEKHINKAISRLRSVTKNFLHIL